MNKRTIYAADCLVGALVFAWLALSGRTEVFPETLCWILAVVGIALALVFALIARHNDASD